ncbi:MAG: histidine--tRNA ligase [Geminicoccaceae bacterium]|nr:MAG: histidine--tRNA ligase [Geminicoccaceae bacterium]
MQLRPPRGTHDLYGDDALRHRHVVETARRVVGCYGYGEMATPIFEFTGVFARSLGETSDVVSKEMYTFTDRGGEEVTLRPENTASVMRAILTGGLLQSVPLRFFYAGPMFRYERPQKGRLRQFHQIGVELVGAAEPFGDVEVIACGQQILEELGIAPLVRLDINSLGNPLSRARYRDQLTAYLARYRAELSEDSQRRLERNPLRILDSKDEGDRRIVQDAPHLAGAYDDESRYFFAAVQDGLARLGIAFTVNPSLVRGLDYYTHTAFEFTTDALGAQGAVIAGGRYDGLMEQLGGPATPGVGWAAGIERMALLLAETPAAPAPVALVPIGEAAEAEALVLAAELRRAHVPCDLAFKGKTGQRMKRADRIGARFAVVFGEDELQAGTVQLKDLQTGDQRVVARADLRQSLE